MAVRRDSNFLVTHQPVVMSGTEEEMQGAMDWFSQKYAEMEPREKDPSMTQEELTDIHIWETRRFRYLKTADFWYKQLKKKRDAATQ